MTNDEWNSGGDLAIRHSSLGILLSLWFSPWSFNILRLLAEPFQFRLQRHHLARNQRVISLRADGVDFAVHFLREKIQRPSDRLLRFPAILELLEMTLKARQFLRNVRAVGEQNNFLQQPLVI